MDNDIPSLSDLTVGQKVIIGEPSFGIIATISKIVPEDPFPIKVDAKFMTFDLSLGDYGTGWSIES